MSGWYEALFRRALFPAYEAGLRRRRTLDYLAEYEHNQWLSADEIAALQWSKLKRLLEHCYRDVPYYRRRWTELDIHPDDIRSLDEYARLPRLSKHDIRAHFDELKASSWRGRLLYKQTGGSTGEPLRFGYTRESNDRRTAVMWRGYAWTGARMGRRSAFLWGGAVGRSDWRHQLKDWLYHSAFHRRMLNTFAMSDENMAAYADAIDAYRPEIIVAYVGPLVRLAQWLIAEKRQIFRPQAILGAAEALHDFQRRIIEQAFGCPAYNTYGCREFMLIASECEQRQGLHVNADHLVVEIDDSDSGLAEGGGEILITDLHNYGMPFVRYANGDMAMADSNNCPCGRGLPLLSRVEGRTLDAIRSADGRVLPGEFFPHMLKDVPGVVRFQVVQRSLEALDLAIVRDERFDESSLAYISREVAKVLGDSVELRCRFVEEIPLTSSGKRRVTVSELPRSGAA